MGFASQSKIHVRQRYSSYEWYLYCMSENLWVLFRAQHKLVTETLRPNTTMTIISSHNFLGSQNIPVQGRALLAAAGFLAQELADGKGIFEHLAYISETHITSHTHSEYVQPMIWGCCYDLEVTMRTHTRNYTTNGP
jgi:hypothetical protein